MVTTDDEHAVHCLDGAVTPSLLGTLLVFRPLIPILICNGGYLLQILPVK